MKKRFEEILHRRKVQGARCRQPLLGVGEAGQRRNFPYEGFMQVFFHAIALEFATIFEIPQSSLNALECKRSSGKDLLKRLEMIIRFPAVALYLLLINGGTLSYEKNQKAEEFLIKREGSKNLFGIQ